MFCKVALICLLGITAINARTIGGYKLPTYPTQNTNEFYPGSDISDYNWSDYGDLSLRVAPPSRHLLPPYEDYGGAQLYSNRNFRSELPARQFRNPIPAEYEEVQHLAPQPYPYEVVNRILPKVKESIDFKPLETQMLAQEQQITQVSDKVKNVQQTVNEPDNYLKGVAAALVPQSKAKNGVIRISMVLVPEEVQNELDNLIKSMLGDDSTETDGTEKENALENFITSMVVDTLQIAKDSELENLTSRKAVEDSTGSDSREKEKYLKKSITSLFGNDSDGKDEFDLEAHLDQIFAAEAQKEEEKEKIDSEEKEKELDNLLTRMFGDDSSETDGTEKEKELDNLLTTMFGDDSTETDGTEKENELENFITSMVVGYSKDSDSAKKEIELENLFSGMTVEGSIGSDSREKEKDFKKSITSLFENDSDEFDLEAHLDQIFAAEAQEEEEKENIAATGRKVIDHNYPYLRHETYLF